MNPESTTASQEILTDDGGYSPVFPLTAIVSSSMSQDVLTTAKVVVDSLSASPVGVFVNPNAGGIQGNAQPEALAVVSMSQNGAPVKQLCHVGRNYSADAGWHATPLFGGREILEVAAGAAFASSSAAAIYGFFTDSSGVYSTSLQPDNTWTAPATISTTPASNLSVAYSPDGLLVLYGSTPQGDLFTAFQPTVGGPFTATVCNLNGALGAGGFQLSLTSESQFTLANNENASPVLYICQLGATEASARQPEQFSGALQDIVLSYWSNSQNTLLFLFVDSDHQLHVWANNSSISAPVTTQIPNATISSAAGYVDRSGSLHVYSTDTNLGLWVLHQDPNLPWNFDGTPNWAPYLSLDSGVGGVATDMNPADAPTLFALDAADASLRLHAQDATSMLWSQGPILQSAAQAYEVTRFRTEVSLIDSNGTPLANYPVTLSVAPDASACEIWAAGAVTPLNSQTESSLSTDDTGRLTFAILTTKGMVTPQLILKANGLTDPLPLQPAEPVHTYLSGKGALNRSQPGGEIQEFDAKGATLASAKTAGGVTVAPGASNTQLAGVAAQAIQTTAMVGLGTTPSGVSGYQMSLSGSSPSFQVLTSQDQVETARALMAPAGAILAGAPGSIWTDIGDFFGDIWQGIKNGVIKVVSALVDVANKVAHFVVQIGKDIVSGIKIALKGLEEAAHFIAGVFHAVEAAIETVIDWLKALFDFASIWRTKMVFQKILSDFPVWVSNTLTTFQKVADGWFGKQESDVKKGFDAAKAYFAGQSLSSSPQWQQPGTPPNNTPIAGKASTSDCTNNVHHNWAQDKARSYSPPGAINPIDENISEAWNAFKTNLGDSASEFITAIEDFGKGILATISHPSEFAKLAIPDFLSAIENLIESILHLADALVDLVAVIADVVMRAIQKLFDTELDIPILSTLWGWMADAAGYPNDKAFTIGALFSLVAAFPTTIIYKLVAGVHEEPFPNGVLPAPPPTLAAPGAPGSFLVPLPPPCILTSAILQTVYFVPAVYGDVKAKDAPTWDSVLLMAMTGVITILANGYPNFTAEEWIYSGGAVIIVGLLILPAVGCWLVGTQVYKDFIADSNDITSFLTTLYGWGSIIVSFIITMVSTNPSPYKAFSGIFLPMGSAFAFLKTSVFRDDPESKPLAIAGNVIADVVAYLAGGALLIVPAAKSLESHQNAVNTLAEGAIA